LRSRFRLMSMMPFQRCGAVNRFRPRGRVCLIGARHE